MGFSADFDVSSRPAAPARLQLVARKLVNDAARRCHTARELAAAVRDGSERALGAGWHVIVGSDFAVELRYRKGACVLLSSKRAALKVLLYRTTPAVTSAPTSEHPLLQGSDEGDITPKRKVTTYESDMPVAALADVVARATRLYNALEGQADADSQLAQALKHSLTFSHGHTWHVVVAAPKDFCCLALADAGSKADFALAKARVVVYKHAGASLDRRMDLAQFAKRAAFVFATICLVVFAFLSFSASETHAKCLVVNGEGAEAVAAGCSEDEVAMAASRALWKKAALGGMTFFTVVAAVIRTYLNAIRPKYKQV